MLLIHYLLSKVKNLKKSKKFNKDFKTVEKRLEYEDFFCNKIVSKLIGNNADKIIQEMTNKQRDNIKSTGTL